MGGKRRVAVKGHGDSAQSKHGKKDIAKLLAAHRRNSHGGVDSSPSKDELDELEEVHEHEVDEESDAGSEDEPQLERAVFPWLARDHTGDISPLITATRMAFEHGVPRHVVMTYVHGEVEEMKACMALPFTLLFVVTYSLMVIMHMDAEKMRVVEYSVAFDVEARSRRSASSSGSCSPDLDLSEVCADEESISQAFSLGDSIGDLSLSDGLFDDEVSLPDSSRPSWGTGLFVAPGNGLRTPPRVNSSQVAGGVGLAAVPPGGFTETHEALRRAAAAAMAGEETPYISGGNRALGDPDIFTSFRDAQDEIRRALNKRVTKAGQPAALRLVPEIARAQLRAAATEDWIETFEV